MTPTAALPVVFTIRVIVRTLPVLFVVVTVTGRVALLLNDAAARSRSGLNSFVPACLRRYFQSARWEFSGVALPRKYVQPPTASTRKSNTAPTMMTVLRLEFPPLGFLAVAFTTERRLDRNSASATAFSVKSCARLTAGRRGRIAWFHWQAPAR